MCVVLHQSTVRRSGVRATVRESERKVAASNYYGRVSGYQIERASTLHAPRLHICAHKGKSDGGALMYSFRGNTK